MHEVYHGNTLLSLPFPYLPDLVPIRDFTKQVEYEAEIEDKCEEPYDEKIKPECVDGQLAKPFVRSIKMGPSNPGQGFHVDGT